MSSMVSLEVACPVRWVHLPEELKMNTQVSMVIHLTPAVLANPFHVLKTQVNVRLWLTVVR